MHHELPSSSRYCDPDGVVFYLHESFAYQKELADRSNPMPGLDWGLYISEKEEDPERKAVDQGAVVEADVERQRENLARSETRYSSNGLNYGAVKWEIEPMSRAPCCQACAWKP